MLTAFAVLVANRVAADPISLVPRISLSEQYNDNVFFSTNKQGDFITSLNLGLTLQYQRPSLTASLSAGTSLGFFAEHTSQNSLARTQSGTMAAQYHASPRLSLSLSDSLARVNAARTGPEPGTTISDSTTPGEPSPADTVSTILPRGDAFSNAFNGVADYTLAPKWTSSVFYGNGYNSFTNPSGLDIRNTIALGLGYGWRPTVSFNGRAAYSLFNLSRGVDTESYSATLGVGYKYSPVWFATVSAGVFVNRPTQSDPNDTIATRVGPTFSAELTRVMENSSAGLGASQLITPSAGVAGVSITQTGFLFYERRLTNDLNGSLTTSYSHFNTSQTDFGVLALHGGLNWPFWRWASAGLTYTFQWREANQPGPAPSTIQAGTVNANIVRLYVTAWYPVWQGDL